MTKGHRTVVALLAAVAVLLVICALLWWLWLLTRPAPELPHFPLCWLWFGPGATST